MDKIISHYQILEKLGEGGMGIVYKAQDTKLDRIVALKFLSKSLLCDEEAKARFVQEAKVASALDHPNIATIYEIDEVEGECFISMAYIQGKTLKQLIKEKQIENWDIGKIIDIGIQAAQGLSKAHESGIVHRDIKSDNIMLTPEGLVKIMDFGLAKLKGITQLTKTGSTLGTVSYMSPEQAQRKEVDRRSDIFSLGVVLYELLTGRLPFQGEHEAAVLYAIINEEPQPVARFNNKVSPDLERIVFKAMAKERDERYQHTDDVLADLRREKKSSEYAKTIKIPPEAVPSRPQKRLLPFLVPAFIVFILVLLFLILKPFKFEIGPEKKAVAQENTLAIMYFENLTDREDTERLGEIVTNLLITDLSESQYMNVVSSQRLYDILKLLGKEGTKVIDKNVASEVAEKAGANWMLLGSILQLEPQFVLTSQLVEVKSGRVMASQRITGEVEAKIFSMVDKLTVEVKKDLSLPAQAQTEKDPQVADVTTHSPEAYRYYLEGLDYFNKLYYEEAERSLRKTLEHDSSFAMAYYRLAQLKGEQAQGKEQRKLIDKAVQYSDKASQKEKYYIRSLKAWTSGDYAQEIKELKKIVERYPQEKEAYFWLGVAYYILGQPEEAVRHYSQTIQIDPLYKLAYNNLAYAYDQIGDFENSIWSINQYISLAPDEANPYDSRADLYAYNGKIDQAIDSYKKASEIKPDFSLDKLGHMYLFKREYAKAESCYLKLSLSSEKETRSQGRTYLAYIPLYQGKLDKAFAVLNDGMAADRVEQVEGKENANKHFLKACIYEEKKNLNAALKELEEGIKVHPRIEPYSPVCWRDHQIQLLAKNNDFEKAEQVAQLLKRDIEKASQETYMCKYWYALGYIDLSKGNTEASVTNLEKATESTTDFYVHLLLAQAYLNANRLGEAVAQSEKVFSRYDAIRANFAIKAVKAYYLLGLAYEKSGWNQKAMEKYEEFLTIWKYADPGIPEVEDAKERLKRLKGMIG